MIGILMWWVGLFLKLLVSFVALVHAKHRHEEMKKKGEEFTIFWKIIFSGLLITFVIGDVFWNFTYGTIANWEVPKFKEKEWTFTERCARHKRESTGWKLKHAVWWCLQLHQIDEGHC